jgi:hypothetical protein
MKFEKRLTNIKLASKEQKLKEFWDVEGIIKGVSNRTLKFDTRPIQKNKKVGYFKSKADKMVFDFKDQWVIVDVPEMSKYVKDNQLKDIHLQDLISKLDWNIILPK